MEASTRKTRVAEARHSSACAEKQSFLLGNARSLRERRAIYPWKWKLHCCEYLTFHGVSPLRALILQIVLRRVRAPPDTLGNVFSALLKQKTSRFYWKTLVCLCVTGDRSQGPDLFLPYMALPVHPRKERCGAWREHRDCLFTSKACKCGVRCQQFNISVLSYCCLIC